VHEDGSIFVKVAISDDNCHPRNFLQPRQQLVL